MYKAQYAFNMSMIMCPAVHMATRSLLRSSSTHEPSDPLSRVKIYNFLVSLMISTYDNKSLSLLHDKRLLSIGISELPWRNPLETNNTSHYMMVACEYQGFYISLTLPCYKKINRHMIAYTLMILPQVHLRKPCYDF
jgi:hypothetical protein